MVRIGIVGIGFMGMIHYLAARRVEGARVVALCSRDPKKLAGDWTSIQGNFGPRGTQMDLSGLSLYADFAAMLADPQVDLVDLCVPNDQHGRLAIQALEAGKHVLVEKPIALTMAEADAMVAAARERPAADGGPRPAVLPRIRLRPRGRPIRPLRRAAGRPLQAGDLQARLVERDRRRVAERRPGDRPAHPRHAFRRAALRRARGPCIRAGSSRTGRSSTSRPSISTTGPTWRSRASRGP